MLAWLLAKLFSTAVLAKALSRKKHVMGVSLITSEMLEDMAYTSDGDYPPFKLGERDGTEYGGRLH